MDFIDMRTIINYQLMLQLTYQVIYDNKYYHSKMFEVNNDTVSSPLSTFSTTPAELPRTAKRSHFALNQAPQAPAPSQNVMNSTETTSLIKTLVAAGCS